MSAGAVATEVAGTSGTMNKVRRKAKPILMRAGTAALPRKGATASSPLTRAPAISQAAMVRSIGTAKGIVIGSWSTNHLKGQRLSWTSEQLV